MKLGGVGYCVGKFAQAALGPPLGSRPGPTAFG